MKAIAMYLPQFHRVKENDEWWGEGFTEWTTVKAAQSLYEGHNQPVVPYNNKYYDLSEKETMQWQADLMKQYGIDGLCMYHYWFKDGRQILEKPAENLLQWADIDMPFCFCWANETWARTWSGIQDVNAWASTFEKKEYNGKSVLLEQKYGTEQEWASHFEYLLTFFRDERYIKIDNKPVFVIYRPELMPCTERMTKYWNFLAEEAGFSGIYFISGVCGEGRGIHDAAFDKLLYCEPGLSIRALREQGKVEYVDGILQVDYDDLWNDILQQDMSNSKVIIGAAVNYDDTPRRGNRGMVVKNASPEKFQNYLAELLGKNKAANNNMVFINAWNEWGEGMYLEPDTQNGYGYLSAIKEAKKNWCNCVDKYMQVHEDVTTNKATINVTESRYKHYLKIYDKWLSLKEQGIKIADYLLAQGYKTVALYGYGDLAKHLVEELEHSEVKINYIIDQNKDKFYLKYPVYCPKEKLPDVDIIIITATYSCGTIFAVLRDKGIYNVISLEEIIMESESK